MSLNEAANGSSDHSMTTVMWKICKIFLSFCRIHEVLTSKFFLFFHQRGRHIEWNWILYLCFCNLGNQHILKPFSIWLSRLLKKLFLVFILLHKDTNALSSWCIEWIITPFTFQGKVSRKFGQKSIYQCLATSQSCIFHWFLQRNKQTDCSHIPAQRDNLSFASDSNLFKKETLQNGHWITKTSPVKLMKPL